MHYVGNLTRFIGGWVSHKRARDSRANCARPWLLVWEFFVVSDLLGVRASANRAILMHLLPRVHTPSFKRPSPRTGAARATARYRVRPHPARPRETRGRVKQGDA